MKCKSKINVSVSLKLREHHVLIKDKWYEFELEPNTLAYIVKCEDGYYRKYDSDKFITMGEFREERLNDLGI
jgi:hypothetical protein